MQTHAHVSCNRNYIWFASHNRSSPRNRYDTGVLYHRQRSGEERHVCPTRFVTGCCFCLFVCRRCEGAEKSKQTDPWPHWATGGALEEGMKISRVCHLSHHNINRTVPCTPRPQIKALPPSDFNFKLHFCSSPGAREALLSKRTISTLCNRPISFSILEAVLISISVWDHGLTGRC